MGKHCFVNFWFRYICNCIWCHSVKYPSYCRNKKVKITGLVGELSVYFNNNYIG